MRERSKTRVLIALPLLLWGVAGFAETTITIEKKKNDAFYSPFGKRDPFRVPSVGGLGDDATVGPLQRFHVEQFKLKAILRGLGEPKAMFQDPKGKSHIVSQGDIIGIERATVSRIIKSEVILTERTFNYLGKESLLERVIALPQDTELDPLQLKTRDSDRISSVEGGVGAGVTAAPPSSPPPAGNPAGVSAPANSANNANNANNANPSTANSNRDTASSGRSPVVGINEVAGEAQSAAADTSNAPLGKPVPSANAGAPTAPTVNLGVETVPDLPSPR